MTSAMIRYAFLSVIFATVTSHAIGEISTNYESGRSLLSRARHLDGNNNYVGNEINSWMTGYALQFEACLDVLQTGNRDEELDDGNLVSVQRLIQFRLCPANNCYRGCTNGGLYAVSMDDFMGSFLDDKMQSEQEICDMARERCQYNDVSICFPGMDYCNQEWDGEEQFDAARYLECTEVEQVHPKNNSNSNNNNYFHLNPYQCFNEECKFYVGPKCSGDGSGINLGVFVDEACSIPAPDGAYEAYNYGSSLPFFNQSMVGSGCYSCQDANGEQDVTGQVTESCEDLYNAALKCEENVTDVTNGETSSCTYLKTVLPELNRIAKESNASNPMIFWAILPIAAAGLVLKYLQSKKDITAIKLCEEDNGGSFSAF